MATVYRKTAKGIAEIETRANRLVPRLRGALILVDGTRSDRDLRALIAAEPDAVLQTLLEQGYVEILAAPAKAPAAGVAVAASPPIAVPAERSVPRDTAMATRPALREVRSQAVRRLIDLLGPMAEGMAMRIERVANWQDLLAILNVACAMIRDMRGGAAAREFAERYVAPYEGAA